MENVKDLMCTQRLDAEPCGLEEIAKVYIPQNCGAMDQTSWSLRWRVESSPSKGRREGAEWEKVLENVSEVVRDLVLTDGKLSLCPVPAYRLNDVSNRWPVPLAPRSPCPSCPPRQEWEQYTYKTPHGTDWDVLKSPFLCMCSLID